MNDSIDQVFADEQRQFQRQLAQVRRLDVAESDGAMAAEKLRHVWAIVGAWQRHKLSWSPRLRDFAA